MIAKRLRLVSIHSNGSLRQIRDNSGEISIAEKKGTYEVGEGIVNDLTGLGSTDEDGGLDILLGLGLSVLQNSLNTSVTGCAERGGLKQWI